MKQLLIGLICLLLISCAGNFRTLSLMGGNSITIPSEVVVFEKWKGYAEILYASQSYIVIRNIVYDPVDQTNIVVGILIFNRSTQKEALVVLWTGKIINGEFELGKIYVDEVFIKTGKAGKELSVASSFPNLLHLIENLEKSKEVI